MNTKRTGRIFGLTVVFIAVVAVAWQTNVVQHEVARVMSGLNPNRNSQIYESLKSYPVSRLLGLLESGDFGKQGQAYKHLFERKDEVGYEQVATMLAKTKNDDAKRYLQKLLLSVDLDKGGAFLVKELLTLESDAKEKRWLLSLLASAKYSPAYPYVEKFAVADSGNKNASSEILRDFGDPRGIPVLSQRLSDDTELSNFERERVEKALAVLQSEVKELS